MLEVKKVRKYNRRRAEKYLKRGNCSNALWVAAFESDEVRVESKRLPDYGLP